MAHKIQRNRRWLALIVLCLGVAMIPVDLTVVNVALPTIRADLGFSETSLVWVVNAYVLTFGGFLLLGGRLGDLYGARRLFLIGIAAFTLASLACGLAMSQLLLVWARAVQGLGGAVVAAVPLSLIMNMFTQPSERARAIGVYGFVCSAGGSVGVLLGGLIATSLNWHWVFLINLPIGVIVYVLCVILIPAPARRHADESADITAESRSLDVLGAITVTASLMLAVYAIVNGNEVGWLSKQSTGLLSAAIVLMATFLAIESRVRAPLMPLGLFRSRALSVANIAAVLWAAAAFAWFFICALYLQRVLGYSAMQVALVFLPANVMMAILSLGLSARLVTRFGLKIPLATGLLLAALGLALLAGAPVNAEVATDILPGMVLLGMGAGIVSNPLLLAAIGVVEPRDSGLASGLVNTSMMMGGALALAILASAAASWTKKFLESGADAATALNGGYHVALASGAGCAAAAAVIGIVFLPAASPDKLPQRESGSSIH